MDPDHNLIVHNQWEFIFLLLFYYPFIYILLPFYLSR